LFSLSGSGFVHAGHSIWPSLLNNPALVHPIGGGDSVLIASTRDSGVTVNLDGSITYTLPPNTHANRVGTIVTANNWTTASDGTFPVLTASFTFGDGRHWGSGTVVDVPQSAGKALNLVYQVRNWSNQVMPTRPDFVVPPYDPSVFQLFAGPASGAPDSVFADLQTFSIPDTLRNTAITSMKFSSYSSFLGFPITHTSALITGLVVWPQFAIQNRQGEPVPHQRQDDATWATDAYGGYVWRDTLVGTDSDLDHLGCFAACAAMVNKFFGVTSARPRTLNQYLQTHGGYLTLNVLHPNNEVVGPDSIFSFVWAGDMLGLGHSILVTQGTSSAPLAEARIVSVSVSGGTAKVTRFLRGGTDANYFGFQGLAFPGVDPIKASLAFSGSLWKLVGSSEGAGPAPDSVERALADSLPVLVGVISPDTTQHWVVSTGRAVSWPTAATPRGTYAIEDPASDMTRLDPTYKNTYTDYYIARRVLAVSHRPELNAILDDDGAGGFAIAAGGPVTLDVRDEIGREIAFDSGSSGYVSGIPQGMGMHQFQVADVASATRLPPCEIVVIPASTSGNYFVTLEGHGTGSASVTFQTRSDPADAVSVSDAQSVSAGSTSYYRLRYDATGATSISIESVAGVPDVRPVASPILKASPNPSFGNTSVRLDLPRGGVGDLRVLDLQGRAVATLRRGQFMAGTTRVDWNGRNDSGARCAAGLYFVRAAVEQTVIVTRVVIVR
jgi:hypothetical protein